MAGLRTRTSVIGDDGRRMAVSSEASRSLLPDWPKSSLNVTSFVGSTHGPVAHGMPGPHFSGAFAYPHACMRRMVSSVAAEDCPTSISRAAPERETNSPKSMAGARIGSVSAAA
jgi:hypothetical protein